MIICSLIYTLGFWYPIQVYEIMPYSYLYFSKGLDPGTGRSSGPDPKPRSKLTERKKLLQKRAQK